MQTEQSIIRTLINNIDPRDGRILIESGKYFLILMDSFYDRNGSTFGVDELLYETARRARDKTVIFVFRDGANIDLSRSLIQIIIKQLGLTQETCVIVNYGPIEIEGATVIETESWLNWESQCIPYIQHLPLASANFDKKFAALFARFNLHRLKLFRHLFDNYSDTSLLAFNTAITQYSPKFQEEFSDDATWCKNNLPINLDLTEDEYRLSGHVPFYKTLANIGNIYQRYFIEIIVETDPHSNTFFTEKTMKNFWLGKPFILFSGAGSLKQLKTFGYKTFSPFIDEQYDEVENDYLRLEMIKREIDRLAKTSLEDLRIMQLGMKDILLHNRLQSYENLKIHHDKWRN